MSVIPDRPHGSTRRELWEHISENPGLSKSELARLAGLGWGTVVYHLDRLSEKGQVEFHEDRGRVRVFPAGLPDQEQRWLSALNDDLSTHIIREIKQEQAARTYRLAASLGTSRKVIRRHLANLEEAGVVRRDARNPMKYRLQPSAKGYLKRQGKV